MVGYGCYYREFFSTLAGAGCYIATCSVIYETARIDIPARRRPVASFLMIRGYRDQIRDRGQGHVLREACCSRG